MPKLLIINVTANWGSTGKIAEKIGEKAQSKGWSVYYAHGSRFVRSSILNMIEVGSKWSDYVHYLWNSYLLGSQGLGSRRPTERLVKMIEDISPDIVHLHNLHGYYINYKVLFEYLNKTNIRVVWTLHDCWCMTGHCTNPTIINCEKWIAGCERCPIRKEYPRSITDRSKRDYHLKKLLFTENPNLILVPVSEWQKRLLAKSFLATKPTLVIHNGIDINVFHNNGYRKYQQFTVIGVSSVWDNSKGLNDFIKLRGLLPQKDVDMILVGLKKEQLANMPVGIKCITRTDSISELVELYSRSHVFVNPTYEDTFPTVNLEALSCGTPVITYCTGGSPEAIDDRTGIVVKQGDVDELARKILWIKNNMLASEDCRKRAELYYNQENCYEQYLQLYVDLDLTDYESIRTNK